MTAAYVGFVNGDSVTSLTTLPSCSTTATSASQVAGSPYVSSCSGAADANYTISYTPGTMTVSTAPLSITASSGSMTYGGTAADRHARPTAASSTATSPASLTTTPELLDHGDQLEPGLARPPIPSTC